MKAHDIVRALRKHHLPTGYAREWAFFAELRVGTGYGTRGDMNMEQRMDAWAMNLWPSKGLERIAYEIKVSRSDFKHEIEQSAKRLPALKLSNLFYFVTPVGLVKPEDIPEECGLMEVDESGKLATVVQAPFREAENPPITFLAALARRGTDAETHWQRYDQEKRMEWERKQEQMRLEWEQQHSGV